MDAGGRFKEVEADSHDEISGEDLDDMDMIHLRRMLVDILMMWILIGLTKMLVKSG